MIIQYSSFSFLLFFWHDHFSCCGLKFLLNWINYGCYFVADGRCIATVSHDRTIKLWSAAEIEKDKGMDLD